MHLHYLCIANAMNEMKEQVNIGEQKNKETTAWRIIDSSGSVKTVIVDNRNTYFLKIIRTNDTDEIQTELLYGQIKPIMEYLGYSIQEMADILEVNSSTISRWKKDDKPIGKMRSKTIYDMDRILSKGIGIFGSEPAFKKWLSTSNYALGDKKPLELLKDPYGIELVENAIEAMSWGNIV
jgi:putative toxin-antitoxin system antitoxin component (TIGR02293 family)